MELLNLMEAPMVKTEEDLAKHMLTITINDSVSEFDDNREDWLNIARQEISGQRPGEKIATSHPFVRFGFVNDCLYPIFSARNTIQAKILGYQPVFGERCALVKANSGIADFVFFDPTFDKEKYEKSGLQSNVRLAALSTSNITVDEDVEIGISYNRFFPPLFYKGGFGFSREIKTEGSYAHLEVTNPLFPQNKLDLIAKISDDKEFKSGDTPQRVSANFYFVGSLV